MISRTVFLGPAIRVARLGLAFGLILVAKLDASEVLRVAAYNVEQIDVGTPDFTALVNVIKRSDADVVLLEEIATNETSDVAVLAAAAGYPWSNPGTTSGTLSGELRNGVLSRYPITSFTTWNSKTISGDPTANDLCRDIPQTVIAVPDVCQPVALFGVHLKSGTSSTDKFRRQVELKRVSKLITNYVTAHPGHHVILGGDFNEDVFDGPFSNTFNSLPSGLPMTYHLGNDVTFPVVYDPFNTIAAIAGIGLTMADATQEDCGSCYATRSSSGRRLDYLFARGTTIVLGDEVYASPVDNGIDDGPIGLIERKFGGTLATTASNDASDHYDVFVDYLLESCDGSRYGLPYSGQYNLAPRAGLKGTAAPGNPGFGMRLLYGRPNALTIAVLGRTQLLPGFPLTPYVPGASLYISLADYYGLFTLVTDADGKALLGLPLYTSPTLIGVPFIGQWFVSDAAGPNGVGSMSDAYSVVVHP